VSLPQIRELAAEDLPAALSLLALLNPTTPPATLAERLAEIRAGHPHYQLFGAFTGSRLVAVAAAWIATRIWCGRYLEIDHLVVDPGSRSAGVGSALIAHLESLGRDRGCRIAVLDSYTSNHASHRLYHRLGFEIHGFHFIKSLAPR
jgi:ribosomal protein S18 acetylase RimI-like enzyme